MDSNHSAATRLIMAIGAPLLLFVAAFLVPNAADTNVSTIADARSQLDLVAAHEPVAYLGVLCIVAGLGATGLVGWQLARLATGRGRTVARIGGGMVLVGGVCAGLANLGIGMLQTAGTLSGVDRTAAAQQLLATESGWPLTPFFLPYAVGIVAGGVVLMIGLLISRALPWWVSVLAGLSVSVLFFSGAGPVGMVTAVVMAVAFVLAARGRRAGAAALAAELG